MRSPWGKPFGKRHCGSLGWRALTIGVAGREASAMDDQPLFDELLRAAENLGVTVRMEPFETPATAGGGSCVFRGEQLILIDAAAPLQVQIAALARALAKLGTEAVFMIPEAREVVEAMKGSRSKGRNPPE